jgi:hypothetical protein
LRIVPDGTDVGDLALVVRGKTGNNIQLKEAAVVGRLAAEAKGLFA